MKHIKSYNESENISIVDTSSKSIRYRQDITKEDKEYFDLIFADFIDSGAKSSLFESDISYSSPGGHASINRKNVRYKIDIDLNGEYGEKNRRVGGVYPVSSNNGNINSLINYTKEMLNYTLELESCMEKIKLEYPHISNFIKIDDKGASQYLINSRTSLSPFKISLLIYHL